MKSPAIREQIDSPKTAYVDFNAAIGRSKIATLHSRGLGEVAGPIAGGGNRQRKALAGNKKSAGAGEHALGRTFTL